MKGHAKAPKVSGMELLKDYKVLELLEIDRNTKGGTKMESGCAYSFCWFSEIYGELAIDCLIMLFGLKWLELEHRDNVRRSS